MKSQIFFCLAKPKVSVASHSLVEVTLAEIFYNSKGVFQERLFFIGSALQTGKCTLCQRRYSMKAMENTLGRLRKIDMEYRELF